MKFLRADTQVIVPVGPAVSISDGFTMVDTSLDISTADAASLIKRNNATAVDISGNTWAAYATPAVHGMYKLTLTAGNLDTEGELTVVIEDVSLALPIREDFMVVNANVYDSLFAASGTDTLDVQVAGMDAGVVTATAVATGAIDADAIAADAITAAKIAADAIGASEIAADAIGSSELATTAVNEIRDAILSDSTAFAGANINSLTFTVAGDVDANVQAIGGSAADAVSLAALGAGLVLTSAVIETVTSQTELVIPATADAVQNDAYNGCIAVLIDADDANNKSFSLITDYVASTRTVTLANAPTFTVTTADTITILAGATASSVWDRVLDGSTHNITNSAGRRVRIIDAAFVVSSGQAQSGAAAAITLQAGESTQDDIYNGDRIVIVGGTGQGEHGIVTDYDGASVTATMSKNWVIQPDSSSEYEIVPADVDVESWANNVVTSSATGLPDVNVNEVGDTAQTAGDIVGAIGSPASGTLAGDLLIIDNFVDTEMAAVLADTDILQSEWADGGRLDLLIDAIKTATDALTASTGEPTGTPAASATLLVKVGFLYMALRNKIDVDTTAGFKEFYDDGGVVEWKKAISDDGSIYTEGEAEAGP